MSSNRLLTMAFYLSVVSVGSVVSYGLWPTQQPKTQTPRPQTFIVLPTPIPEEKDNQVQAGLGLLMQENLRTAGYEQAVVFVQDKTLRIYNTGIPSDLVAKAVMRQRELVKLLKERGVTRLEVSQYGTMLPSTKADDVHFYVIR
jgi:hypothetical protein